MQTPRNKEPGFRTLQLRISPYLAAHSFIVSHSVCHHNSYLIVVMQTL
jgi:hypothetical protein